MKGTDVRGNDETACVLRFGDSSGWQPPDRAEDRTPTSHDIKYFVVEIVNAGKVVTGSLERNVLRVLPIVFRCGSKRPQK